MNLRTLIFLGFLIISKIAHANQTQSRMARCGNLASISSTYAPDQYKDMFRGHSTFFSLTALTLGSKKEYSDAEIKKLNESILTSIEATYKKNPKAILKESAACTQWMDQMKEAAKLNNYDYASSYPKTIENVYTHIHSTIIDGIFREWMKERASDKPTANSKVVPNLFCSAKTPGGQVIEGLLSVDTKNTKVTFAKATNLDAEISNESIRFSLRSEGLPIEFFINRFSGSFAVSAQGSVIASGNCETAAQKKF